MRYRSAALAIAGVATAAMALVLGSTTAAVAAPSSTAAQVATARSQLRAGTLGESRGVIDICAAHHLACHVEIVTTSKHSTQPLAFKPPVGYGADELEAAYGLDGAPSADGTIVIVDAGAYPTLESDLAVYRSAYHLPPCTTANGCFRQMNYLGGAPYPPATSRFREFAEEEIGVETSLDVDMASAACPGCKIVEMQVPLLDGFFGNKTHIHHAIKHFATAVQTAHQLGASAVSISYGYPTDSYSDSGHIARLMSVPGMAIVSSSGDGGFTARFGQWPQSLRTVTSAGGTSLYADKSTARGWSEVAWNGAGSDCTTDLGPALGQPAPVSAQCHGHRATSDMSAVADPYTGVAVYDSYAPGSGEPFGFIVVGGTSVASPLIGGMYARAPQNPATHGPNTIYHAPASAFNDVVIGTNAGIGYCRTVNIGDKVCDSGPGWDGPTGRGTPNGLAPFTS